MPGHYLEDALRGAIKARNLDHVKDLIERINESSASDNPSKATLEALDDDEQTFLHYALACGAKDAFDILFPHCKDWSKERLQSRDKHGRTIFWWAVARSYPYIAEKVLDAQYRADTPALDSWLQDDYEGASPLHMAAGSTSPTLLPWLLGKLDNRDDPISMVNLFDANYNTPLHYACQKKQRQHIATLLKAGAAIDLVNNKGESFLTYIEQDPTLFDIRQYNDEIQSQILQHQRSRLRDNPNDELLKKFHAQLSSQVSLLEIVRQKIVLDMEIAGQLDDVIQNVLYPMSKTLSERLFHRINKDKLLLEGCDSHISAAIGRMASYDKEFNPPPKHMHNLHIAALFLGVFGVIGGGMISGIGWAFVADKTLTGILAVSLFSLPVIAWIGIAVAVLALVATGVCIGMYVYKRNTSRNSIRESANELLAEIKNVHDKLITLEKTDAKLLPVNPAIIRALETNIQSLEQFDDKGYGNAIQQLKIIKTIFETIKLGIIKNHKPLTLATVKAVPEKAETVITIPKPAPSFALQKPPIAEGSTPASFIGAMFTREKQEAEEKVYVELAALSPPSDDEAAPLLAGQADAVKEKVGIS